MSPLQIIIILASFFFFILAIDAYKRKKLNWLHVFFFIFGTIVLIIFSLNITLLNKFWSFFGISRGADLLVYCSIILIMFFYFELLHKFVKNDNNFTNLVLKLAIENAIFPKLCDINKLDAHLWTNSKFLFLIRAYNEEKVVSQVIDDIIQSWYGKILLVNDWSNDNTLEIFKEKQLQYPDSLIIILSHIMNRWPWAANKTWFQYLKQYWDQLGIERIVTYDADWQMDINDMKVFQQNITPNIFAYWWSRYVWWWRTLNQPFLRKLVLKWSRIVTLLFNNVWISDPHNWYRVLSLDLVKKVQIYSDWMTYASELLESVHRNWYKIKEVPVVIKYTDYTLQKWQKNSSAFKILFELIYKKFFFR